MIGQQLDLFGGPLRPPKKIKVDEVQEDKPAKQNTGSKRTESSADSIIHVQKPVVNKAALQEENDTIPEEEELIVAAFEQQESAAFEEMQVLDDSTDSVVLAAPTEKSKAESGEVQQVAYRGRKTGDPDQEMEMLNVPPDEALFKRQYYSMRETAAMFNVNQALLRFWENEFDILQPKKNKKGDRYFRPVDVKNLVLIYHLLRVRKFTMEGAKDYLSTHKKAGDSFQLVQRLEKLKSFLLELKANL